MLAAIGWPATPAVADWMPAVSLDQGPAPVVAPVVGFGPTGYAAVGFQTGAVASFDDGGALTYLARRPAGGGFGTAVPVAPPGSTPAALQSVLLPGGGGTVLLFGPVADAQEPWSASVEPAGAQAFGAPQQLVGAMNDPEAGNFPLVQLDGTARGEVVGAVRDEHGYVSSTVLAPGASRFRSGPQLSRLYNTGDLGLAADGVGGAFLAGDSGGCAGITYRRVGGGFGVVHQPRRCHSADGVGLAASGNGYAALATVYDDFRRGHVAVQVGRPDSFGALHVLATTPYVVNTSLLGPPAEGERGALTVAWAACGSQDMGCSIAAASGSLHGGFGRSQILATTPRTARAQLCGLLGAGTVAVQRCGPGRPGPISVAVANRNGRFGRLAPITADGQLQLLVGDARGDQLIVWTTHNGGLYAATRQAGAARFAARHRLSASGVRSSAFVSVPGCAQYCPDAAEVNATFGPRGEVIVAWSLSAGATFAAVYRSASASARRSVSPARPDSRVTAARRMGPVVRGPGPARRRR